jgi:hypothetical protein
MIKNNQAGVKVSRHQPSNRVTLDGNIRYRHHDFPLFPGVLLDSSYTTQSTRTQLRMDVARHRHSAGQWRTMHANWEIRFLTLLGHWAGLDAY